MNFKRSYSSKQWQAGFEEAEIYYEKSDNLSVVRFLKVKLIAMKRLKMAVSAYEDFMTVKWAMRIQKKLTKIRFHF